LAESLTSTLIFRAFVLDYVGFAFNGGHAALYMHLKLAGTLGFGELGANQRFQLLVGELRLSGWFLRRRGSGGCGGPLVGGCRLGGGRADYESEDGEQQ